MSNFQKIYVSLFELSYMNQIRKNKPMAVVKQILISADIVTQMAFVHLPLMIIFCKHPLSKWNKIDKELKEANNEIL